LSQKLYYVPLSEIRRFRKSINALCNPYLACKIMADIVRINALYMIKRSESGHLGSSFSSIEIITYLWEQVMKLPNERYYNSPNFNTGEMKDTYFSSKGHDVPALYSLLIALEKIDFEMIHKLRRLEGLPGHPDIKTNPILVANTGSLGMGISKAKRLALVNRLKKHDGHFYVLAGDGELQEGQIWESLATAATMGLSEITLIVDHNKMQSDTWVKNVSDLGNLGDKFKAFGWIVERCDGHDFRSLEYTFNRLRDLRGMSNQPQVLIAETVKGKGVSFMESNARKDGDYYHYHSGAPSDSEYQKAFDELFGKANQKFKFAGFGELKIEEVFLPANISSANVKIEKLVLAYEEELANIGEERKDLVVLDADLVKDCGLMTFKEKFPKRFIECGIAEQDMVSMAGGLAKGGMLPIVNSFGRFLAPRANEQMYSNASEGTKVIYSGQSVRDISLLGSMPNLILLQPSNAEELKMALRWAVYENPQSTYLRICSFPCEASYFRLPKSYSLKMGQGVFVGTGTDAVLIAYGPMLLRQAQRAAQKLSEKNISTAVINFPWLNRVDKNWLMRTVFDGRVNYKIILTLDDQYADFGQGMMLKGAFCDLIANLQVFPVPKIISMGFKELPACGQPDEVLKYHDLDVDSIVKKVEESL